MDRILEKIYQLIQRDYIDTDWKTELDRLGIWDNVFDLYSECPNGPTANRLLAFAVLAYSFQSEMLDISKDRLEVKRKIMIRLFGLSYNDSKIVSEAATGLNVVVNRVSHWVVEEQKDWRWGDIVTKIEHHSRVNAMSVSELEPDSDSGKKLKEATALRKEAEEMWNELRKSHLSLDNALVAEGRPKITDMKKPGDFMSWENYIRNVESEKKRKREEEDERIAEEKEVKRQAKEDAKIQKDSAKVY